MHRDAYTDSERRWEQRRYCSDSCKTRSSTARQKARKDAGRGAKAKKIAAPSARHLTLVYSAPEPSNLPATRAECRGGPRPCPLISCRWNLYLDVEPNGAITLNFPDREPEDMVHSCALDIAEAVYEDDTARLDAVGAAMNLCGERVRQIEEKALRKLARNKLARGLR
jgi:hypothetical protein